MRKKISCFLLMLCCVSAYGQYHEVLTERIQSLHVATSDNYLGMPIIELGSGESVEIRFDVMTHDYCRFSYTLQHCEADWTVSEGLFESDYLEGFTSGMLIEDSEKSLNTATLYSHYVLRIPNTECRIKMSGNYLLTVYDDDADGTEVMKVCFMVVESKMSVGMNVTTLTDIENNGRYQQADVTLGYNGVVVTAPEQQLKVFVMQNRRWSTARCLPRPQAFLPSGMKWYHCKDLIFPATNEYRKFEFLDLRRSTMGVESTDFDGSNYIVNLYPDAPRRNYVYDEDADGAFVVRNFDDRNNDTESEYFLCNFTYLLPEPLEGEVFLNGQWTCDRLEDKYRMTYDIEGRCYRATMMMKMGYYNYQYLLRRPDGTVEYLPTEGNFSQTANHYSCLVYYRPQGGRTDLLYGVIE